MTLDGIPKLRDVSDLKGKRVLLRLDLNVPMEGNIIRDTFRIDSAIPTLEYLREKGAKTIVISHIGKDGSISLRPIAEYLNAKVSLTFIPQLEGVAVLPQMSGLKDGDIVMLENLRGAKGEETNDPVFAQELASLGDLYVNDAFSVAHRKHASVVGVPALIPGVMGFQFTKEVESLAQALHPEHPFVFILGGAKIETKMPLLKKFLDLADHVFVGGALVNTLFVAKGYEVGTSVYDKDAGDLSLILNNTKAILPEDVVVRENETASTVPATGVSKTQMIVDVGNVSIEKLRGIIAEAKLVVWNGPLGFYEQGFKQGTEQLLQIIAESKATSIIGGGDTVALIDELGMKDKFTFISTGGGAMLDLLANETLPGIEALRK